MCIEFLGCWCKESDVYMHIASWLLGQRDVHIISWLLVQGVRCVYAHCLLAAGAERCAYNFLAAGARSQMYICTLPVGCWGREMCIEFLGCWCKESYVYMHIACWLLGQRDVHRISWLLVQGVICIYAHCLLAAGAERCAYNFLAAGARSHMYICTLPVGCWGREMCI